MLALDPELVGNSHTVESFKTLAKKIAQVFPAKELGQLSVDAAG